MRQLGFATFQDQPHGTADDRLVIDQLKQLGVEVIPLIWDADWPDPGSLSALVVRSCWDYHLKVASFGQWLDLLDQRQIQLFNSSKLIRWNLDKRYLKDLAAQGIVLPTTLWIQPGAAADLKTLLIEHQLDAAVIKPMVSLSAFQTWRTSVAQAPAHQGRFAQQVAERGILVQAFIDQVLSQGEISFIFLGGRYSHAVRKQPSPGDFRVQADFGGTRAALAPARQLIAQAQAVIDLIDEPLLFARVDGIDVAGQLMLMELELIDPELFLAYDQHAPRRFAEAIMQALG